MKKTLGVKDKTMIFRFIMCILIFLPVSLFGQDALVSKIDSLKFIDDMPYICRSDVGSQDELSIGCGARLFWEIVKQKENVIPFLIEKLSDSTLTKSIVPNFGYNYSVADIAFVALKEIIHTIPTFDLLGVGFDKNGCGYCSYWKHLSTDYQNRINFQIAVQAWYSSNKEQLVWVESNTFSSCDCSGSHPNGGHYRLIK
jgi:hypothetical protein